MRGRLICVSVLWMGLGAAVLLPAQGQQGLPLRVSLNVNVSNLPLMIALEEGIYQKNGLEVKQFVPPDTAEEVKAYGVIVPAQYISPEGGRLPLAEGNGFSSIYTRATNASAPLDRVIIATVEPVLRYHVVVQPEITRMEELKGKRLGVTSMGGSSSFAALVVAQRMGWDPVLDVAILANGVSLAALKNRRVDAILCSEFRYAMLTAAGYKSVLDTSSWKVPMPGSGWVTTRSWLRDNHETARRFIRSLVEGTAVMKQDKQKTLRTMTKWWGLTDAKRLEELYAAALELPSKPYPAVDGIRKAMELYPSSETRKFKLEEFYDDSFVRELDQSGFIDGLYK